MRVISVFGPFGSKALVEMSVGEAKGLIEGPMVEAAPMDVIDGVLHDLQVLMKHDETIAESALAATAVMLAKELANPYNSATSKSMCAKELKDTLAQLRGMVPPERKKDALDGISEHHAARRRGANAAHSRGS